MGNPVRTRFAPSPTGYLHIGGVRTALYNWLYARQHGGAFILRIDDTDQERNVAAALQPILDGFRWLGLDWDEGALVGGDHGPYYQSDKLLAYQAAVDTLLDRGLAYRDYATPDELAEERTAAEKAGETFVYSRRFLAETFADQKRFEAEGRKGVVRLLMPRDGECRFHDLIRGDMTVSWSGEQDHVIQRADGSCLYHLASVVDDRDMEITHVIRAQEHLSNTPRQLFIARGLDITPPAYAHLPVVAAPGGKQKLSKRKIAQYRKHPEFARIAEHGESIARRIGLAVDPESWNPVLVEFYETVGYRPDAVVNYLLLLGWAFDDRTEFFSRDEMIRAFSLEKVNKAPASFDPQKLLAFEEHYMNEVPVAEKAELVMPFLVRAGLVTDPDQAATRDRVRAVVAAAGERLKVAGDILDYAEMFVADHRVVYDDKAFTKRIQNADDAIPLLEAYRDDVALLGDFDVAPLEAHMARFVEARGLSMGRIIHAVRVATTGKAVGFGMFESLAILGKDRVLARLDRALAHARGEIEVERT